MAEPVCPGQLDGASPNIVMFQTTLSSLGNDDRKGIVRFDATVQTHALKRSLQVLTGAYAHAAGASRSDGASPLGSAASASATTPPSTFSEPERNPRRSIATRSNPAASTASRRRLARS